MCGVCDENWCVSVVFVCVHVIVGLDRMGVSLCDCLFVCLFV